MDNLLAQMYYNPNLLDVLKKLIIGEKEDWVKKRDLKHYKSAPSGNLYLIDMPSFQNDEYIINCISEKTPNFCSVGYYSRL